MVPLFKRKLMLLGMGLTLGYLPYCATTRCRFETTSQSACYAPKLRCLHAFAPMLTEGIAC